MLNILISILQFEISESAGIRRVHINGELLTFPLIFLRDINVILILCALQVEREYPVSHQCCGDGYHEVYKVIEYHLSLVLANI